MALIKCPDCGTEVSDSAQVCTKCGRPIAGGNSDVAHTTHVTVEKTKKSLKIQQLFSIILIIASVILIIMKNSDGGDASYDYIGLGIGIVWLILVKIAIWWNHA